MQTETPCPLTWWAAGDSFSSGTGAGNQEGDCRGSLVDVYVRVVENHLSDRGRLYVIGYPSIVAPTVEWSLLQKGWGWGPNLGHGCWGIHRTYASTLIRAATYLTQSLGAAVQEVNRLLGESRVRFVDVQAVFREDGHELCGSGDDWLHGIKGTDNAAYHPNQLGHAAIA